MKRALALLVGGVLILGSALAAHAQAPTVSFGGQMRVYGFATNNTTDFQDSDGTGTNRDSTSFYFQRWRLYTTVESADKKAKAYWALEVGDITWGNGGGANANSTVGCVGQAPFVPTATITTSPGTGPDGKPLPPVPTPATVSNPGSTTRTGNNAGGCLGADGINVETKNIYVWLDTGQWVPGTNIQLGIGNIVFMNGPLGAFADDDAASIILNWNSEMVDVQAWMAKLGEGNTANADDTDAWALRVGVNVTKEIRVTLEGLLLNEMSMPGQNVGDTFWIGATASAKLGDVQLDGAFVYGQREYISAAGAGCQPTCQEAGFGAFVLARIPIGPLSVNALGWWTEGDQNRPPGGGAQGAGSNTVRLTADSDKLPMPWQGGGWFNGGGAYMGEWMLGLSTIGNPGPGGVAGQTFGDPTGTYGVGSSVIYALTPALSLGGGGAYIGASDQGGVWGDWVLEFDAGLTYRFNPNVTFNLFAGYMLPDSGDNAWGAAFRTVFQF
jgi:hypothetical protein